MINEMLDYDFGEVKSFNEIHKKPTGNDIIKSGFEFKPEMLDYIQGDTSLRFEYIKSIKDEPQRIKEMSDFLKTDIIKWDFPNEFFEWYARDILGLKYKKYEIDKMKREYRIKKKREQKKLKEQKKKNKNKNQITFKKESKILVF